MSTAARVRRPGISILYDKFIGELRSLKYKKVADELLVNLFKDVTMQRGQQNVVRRGDMLPHIVRAALKRHTELRLRRLLAIVFELTNATTSDDRCQMGRIYYDFAALSV